ncbi:hypothetical protein E1A91_A06G140600v1 [Gossypium mustelinum]|uniref:Cyclic phosphodiesterase-like n=1 Tax=Gossypium mustelinum TaxID=34275 RepID=A0A5D2YX35_GOSMU|nr:hypothetical protein E1A91_A06G140600v1 [Gossypium mustelinum]
MCHLAQVAILKPQTHIFSIFKNPYSISKSLQVPTNYSLSARSTSMGTPEAVVKKDVYSVWALPHEDVTARVKKLMEGLRSEFGGPQFEPHVTVVGAISLTADDALASSGPLVMAARLIMPLSIVWLPGLSFISASFCCFVPLLRWRKLVLIVVAILVTRAQHVQRWFKLLKVE